MPNVTFKLSSVVTTLVLVVLGLLITSSLTPIVSSSPLSDISKEEENVNLQLANFIKQSNKEFISDLHSSNDGDELNQHYQLNTLQTTRAILQESCVPLIEPVEYCRGFIPNNVSYIVSKSMNTVESRLISQLDNFITRIESNYGSIPSSCKTSATNLYCSMAFRRCVHDRSQGHVDLYKPCQYLCRNIYLNCIPDRSVAIASANNDCGDDNYPSNSYSEQPECTDIYFDRDLTAFYIMSFTLLGLGVMSSLVFASSFLFCICCAKSVKLAGSGVAGGSATGDAYNSVESETGSVNRNSINSSTPIGIDFSLNGSSGAGQGTAYGITPTTTTTTTDN